MMTLMKPEELGLYPGSLKKLQEWASGCWKENPKVIDPKTPEV